MRNNHALAGASRAATALERTGRPRWPQAARTLRLLVVAFGINAISTQSSIAESDKDACLLGALATAEPDTTVAELHAQCETRVPESEPVIVDSLIMQRFERERVAGSKRSVLIPHLRNYLIPVSYSRNPNNAPFEDTFGDLLPEEAALDNFESKFQVSLKFSLADNLFMDQDELFIGFTAKSFWQVYNSDVSAPFRETNYEPEIFWAAPLSWKPFETDSSFLSLGFSHQSNGRGGGLSRSWNRVYANFALEKNRFVFSLKPWWRIPEDEKSSPLDASGDDNPDIEKFMGHFEFTTLYRSGTQEIGLMLRNNLRSENKGAIQLDWTFPLWRGVRGYVQYFNGYGESLIDYNARIERLGFGFLLTDLL